MPDLPAFYDIDDVIEMTPGISELCFKRAIVLGYECIPTGQLPVVDRVFFYIVIEAEQGSFLLTPANFDKLIFRYNTTIDERHTDGYYF